MSTIAVPLFDAHPCPGVGKEARNIRRTLVESLQTVWSSPGMQGRLTRLHAELSEAAREAEVPNWDGYDAVPVKHEAMAFALGFLECLPLEYPLAEISIDPDGDVCLEWSHAKRTLSISIDEHGTIRYAAIAGESEHHGRESWGEGISANLLAVLRSVLRGANSA